MTDTVTRLMGMIDLLCSACVDDVVASDQAICNYESNATTLHTALEAELTRLFTPLSDEQIADFLGDEYHHMTESELRYFRLAEKAHGIGGKS